MSIFWTRPRQCTIIQIFNIFQLISFCKTCISISLVYLNSVLLPGHFEVLHDMHLEWFQKFNISQFWFHGLQHIHIGYYMSKNHTRSVQKKWQQCFNCSVMFTHLEKCCCQELTIVANKITCAPELKSMCHIFTYFLLIDFAVFLYCIWA